MIDALSEAINDAVINRISNEMLVMIDNKSTCINNHL